MEQEGNTFCLEVWGDYACFTRPEFKVERVSYDVITPSAARAIFEAVFWKPAIRWEVTEIEVLNPIKWMNIKRNEVGYTVPMLNSKPIYIEHRDLRDQRISVILKDVHYRISARLMFTPIRYRNTKNPDIDQQEADMLRIDENLGKYNAMFQRRARKGQCFTTPYLGNREFSANFRLMESEIDRYLLRLEDKNINFGLMFYDWDYTKEKAMFFNAIMENGIIKVPTLEEVKRINK